MKIELKEITEQLTSALGLKSGLQVAACFKEPGSDELVGWIVVKKGKNGNIMPQGEKVDNLKELFEKYGQRKDNTAE